MSEPTRERIITAAELLFARQGYAATSVREITEAAGVNIAAVNYHFGSKENLLVEILDRIVTPLNAQRLELLDQLEAQETPGVQDLLAAFLLPDLRVLDELRSRDPDLPRFVSRMYSEGSQFMTQVMGQQFAGIQDRFLVAFQNALPHLSPDEIGWRLHCVVGIVLYLFAGVEVPGIGPMVGPNLEQNLARLLNVTTPMMSAPMPAGKNQT